MIFLLVHRPVGFRVTLALPRLSDGLDVRHPIITQPLTLKSPDSGGTTPLKPCYHDLLQQALTLPVGLMKRQKIAASCEDASSITTTADMSAETGVFDPACIPVDILPLIFEHLTDRRDLHTCARLSKTFHAAATPILYRSLDSRVLKSRTGGWPVILHPARTLLERPEYAKYVRQVRLTGAMGTAMPELVRDCYEALRLCVNLESFRWIDDSPVLLNDEVLLGYLSILRDVPIKQLTIRTYLGLSEDIWTRLIEFRGLCEVSIWTMEGPPRILQGWSEKLGPSLTHLELGRCAGVPASILVSVISHLPHLRSLRLKGAPTSAILEILTFLPQLVMLDTEYFGSGFSRYVDVPVASLRELTVRTSSVDVQGPQQLWSWIQSLLPRPSLESFTLNAFSTQGDAAVPRQFLLTLANMHKETLKTFTADSALLTLDDVRCLCALFPALESLSCSIAWCQDASQIEEAVSNGLNLHQLRLYTSWVPTRYGSERVTVPFTIVDARKMMLRDQSRLRVIVIGRDMYTGRWVQNSSRDGLEFEVICDVVHDS